MNKFYKSKIFIILFICIIFVSAITFFANDYLFEKDSFVNKVIQYTDNIIDLTYNRFFLKNKKYLVIERLDTIRYSGASPFKKSEKWFSEDTKIVFPEKISNVGYVFYLGLLDYDEEVLQNKIKNEFTITISNANFPKNLLDNLTFVIVNTLAVKPETYIETKIGLIQIKDFDPNFLKSGGLYSQNILDQSFIFIGKNLLENTNQLRETLTHELGHHVSTKLSDEDWEKYYKLRNISANTTKQGTSWETSPMEDFAEVYKNIFTGGRIRTMYGLFEGSFKTYDGDYIDIGPCSKIVSDLKFSNTINGISNDKIIYNTELQNCRRENHTSYTSIVDSKTKEFILGFL